MAATSIGAVYPRGLPDHLRDVTRRILSGDPTTVAFFGEPHGSIVSGALPSVTASHVTVSLTDLDSEQEVGGYPDQLAIATTYALRNFKLRIDYDEASVGAVVDHHKLLLGEKRNAALAWPQDPGLAQRVFVSHFEGFRPVEMDGNLFDKTSRADVTLTITAVYRLMPDARRRWQVELANP